MIIFYNLYKNQKCLEQALLKPASSKKNCPSVKWCNVIMKKKYPKIIGYTKISKIKLHNFAEIKDLMFVKDLQIPWRKINKNLVILTDS